jgi:hypothetical protein
MNDYLLPKEDCTMGMITLQLFHSQQNSLCGYHTTTDPQIALNIYEYNSVLKSLLISLTVAVKRCSDGFLNAFEKHWNMKPVVNLTVLNKMFQDMAPQFQNYVTYCSHQEDLHTVLRTAMYVLVHL